MGPRLLCAPKGPKLALEDTLTECSDNNVFFEMSPDGRHSLSIGSVILNHDTVILGTGSHADQLISFVKHVNEGERGPAGLQEMGYEDVEVVPLDLRDGIIKIRPEPQQMDRCFAADKILKELLGIHYEPLIRFSRTLDERVRLALMKKGDLWRMDYVPRTREDIIKRIRSSKITISSSVEYYKSESSGTRYLTFAEFSRLGSLGHEELQRCLSEISEYSIRTNMTGQYEIDFFMADRRLDRRAFGKYKFAKMNGEEIALAYRTLKQAFESSLAGKDYLEDDIDNNMWRNNMLAVLLAPDSDSIPRVLESSEGVALGIDPLVSMNCQWLIGGKMFHGVFLPDPLLKLRPVMPPGTKMEQIRDEKVEWFAYNMLNRFPDMTSINIARLVEPMSNLEAVQEGATHTVQNEGVLGRSEGYLKAITRKNAPAPAYYFGKMQKWDVRGYIQNPRRRSDSGLDRTSRGHKAVVDAREYTEYVKRRAIAFRVLGGQLGTFEYDTVIEHFDKAIIYSTYFHREYIPNSIATNKIPRDYYFCPGFNIMLAELLGRAAAVNAVVGRTMKDDMDVTKAKDDNSILFDSGYELVILSPNHMPDGLMVTSPMHTFYDFKNQDLLRFAPEYSKCAASRTKYMPNPEEFCRQYAHAFALGLKEIQVKYLDHRQSFRSAFIPPPELNARDEVGIGTFPFRWLHVLTRLEKAEPDRFKAEMLKCMGFSGTCVLNTCPVQPHDEHYMRAA